MSLAPEAVSASAVESPTRPLYWSVRRELWENRSIYLAPLTVAGLVLFSFLVRIGALPQKMRALPGLDAAAQSSSVIKAYSMAASVILMTTIVIAFAYCIDALNSERRDRSILFWKSLPVSDRTTVLSKAAVPLLVLPLVGCLIALATQIVMLLLSTVVLAANGVHPGVLWSRLPLPSMTVVMFYGTFAHALWFAPLYGWLLLVSAWARRAALLWAVVPPVALLLVERATTGSGAFASLLKYRFAGAMQEAFTKGSGHAPIVRFSSLTPLNFLTSPGLWFGLLFAAGFLAAAVYLRRRREPI